MNFKIGDKYHTSDGSIVRILALDLKNETFPIVGALTSKAEPYFESLEMFTPKGKYNKGENKWDIVKKYEDVTESMDEQSTPPSIVLEVGKKYVTQEGSIVRIICTDANDTHYPIVGLVAVKNAHKDCVETYTRDGELFIGSKSIAGNIIAEYVEPDPVPKKIVPWSLKNHPTGAIFVRNREAGEDSAEYLIVRWAKVGAVMDGNARAEYEPLLKNWIQSNGQPCGWDETV